MTTTPKREALAFDAEFVRRALGISGELRSAVFESFERLVAAAVSAPAPQVLPAACQTYQTTSGETTVCRRCGESWQTGRERACMRAAAILDRAALQGEKP